MSDQKIHKLTERLLPGEVDALVVETLRDLLARAERGEITAIAFAGAEPNGGAFHGWEGSGGTSLHLGAAILGLQVRYALQMTDDHP
jgi:hypothetical protein